MQNNEQNLETPNELQPFFFEKEEIYVWQYEGLVFDFCAADVFRGLCLATTPTEYSAIYKKLAVKYIAPARLFVDKKGNSMSLKMLNLEGVKHLAKPLRTKVGKAFLHWATVDLPALAEQKVLNKHTQNIDFQIFNFQNNQNVRVITDANGNPWFVATDICSILEYANSRKAIEDNCKKDGVTKGYIMDRLQRKQEVVIINEANLYRLITRSTKKQAIIFSDWVMEEVLPTLRKTGKYEIPTIVHTPKPIPPSTEISTDAGFTPKQIEYLQKIIREAVLEASLNYQEQLDKIQKILPAFVPTLVECKPSYVYLGQNQDNAHCKVGKSNEPLSRIFELELGGSKIKLLATLKLPSEELALFWEEVFHKMFEKYDLGRDWFNLPILEINTLVKLIEFLNSYYEAIM